MISSTTTLLVLAAAAVAGAAPEQGPRWPLTRTEGEALPTVSIEDGPDPLDKLVVRRRAEFRHG